jgi:hypothetical protein
MTKYATFFVIVIYLGSSIGREASAASPGNGPRAASSNERDTGLPDWMTSYYQNPHPDHFVTEVRQLSQRGILSAPVTTAFLGRVLAQNPAKIPEWMAALADLPDGDKEVLHKAIWLSGTDAGKAYLKDQGLADLLNDPSPDLLKEEIDSPSTLDMLWGYYFATGDEAPVRRIVSALNYSRYAGAMNRYETSRKTSDDRRQAYYDAIFAAAVSSLSSAWRQDPRIKEICDELLKGNKLNATETELLKVMLANLTAETDARHKTSPGAAAQDPDIKSEWTKAERGFGAMLFFSDKPQQFLDDWNKPGATVDLGTSSSHAASRGKPCVAFIVFTGCGADQQGLADVVADISMLTPDGKVIGARKGVEIWQKRPAPPEKRLELGVGNLGMVLTPDDPLGTYEIHAKVSDRVKGVVLELKTKFSVDK